MRTRFYGHAGSSARHLAGLRRGRRFGIVVLTSAIAILLVLGGWYLAAACCALGGRVAASAMRGRVARADAGADAEAFVASHLRRVRAEAVVFDVPLPRGDADVLVLGPMAAVIEVKRAHGRVRTHRDGSVTVGGKRLPGRPLRQAVGAAAATAQLIGPAIWVDAIVCVSGMVGRTQVWTENGHEVLICSPRRLHRTLRRLPRPLGRGLGRDLAADLTRRVGTSHRARRRV